MSGSTIVGIGCVHRTRTTSIQRTDGHPVGFSMKQGGVGDEVKVAREGISVAAGYIFK